MNQEFLFCPRCGAVTPPGVCTNCGFKIETEKENGKYYDDTPEEKQSRKETIKELRKDLKRLNKVCESLHY